MNLPRVLSKKEPVWSAIVIICLAATFLYFGIIAFAIEVIVAIAISKFFDGRKEIVKEFIEREPSGGPANESEETNPTN